MKVKHTHVDGNTFTAKSTGSPNAVNIVFTISNMELEIITSYSTTWYIRGEVIVDDKRDLLNVDSTGPDICSDQNTSIKWYQGQTTAGTESWFQ